MASGQGDETQGEYSQAQRGLFAAALQPALICHMLPKLDPVALGRLACTCKAGREVVHQAGPEVWREAAVQVLPWRHPVRRSSEVNVLRTDS